MLGNIALQNKSITIYGEKNPLGSLKNATKAKNIPFSKKKKEKGKF